MDLHLREHVIVITGGGTGIGKAAALEFAREGATVCILGRRELALQQACDEARREGLVLYMYPADATDPQALQAVAESIAERFHTIDVWINNAGTLLIRPMLDVTREDWQSAMDANLYSVLLGTQIAAPYMKAQRGGVILNASSFAAKIPNASSGVYAIAKSGVSMMTKVLSSELAPYGIRVAGYMPGPIATEMTSSTSPEEEAAQRNTVVLHRRGKAEEAGKLLVLLASDACSYISGVDVEISGGKFAVQNPNYYW